MTTRLTLYNGALREIGERKLASLSESREPRRVLDDIWDNGLIDFVLEQGLWNFAMRTIRLDYSPSVEPDFGYTRAFDKPTDWIRTAAVCSDEYFTSPVTRYSDEAGYWYSDLDELYIQHVSNHSTYGSDLSRWPQTFCRYVESYLAELACDRLTQSNGKLERLQKQTKKRLADARSKDAMNQPAQFPPTGSWVSARHGRS